MLLTILNKIPGGKGVKVFVGTAACMTFCAIPFLVGPSKKVGHGAFDVDKPEAVQQNMDRAEEQRLSRLVKNAK